VKNQSRTMMSVGRNASAAGAAAHRLFNNRCSIQS
jgi:hypothetical protein